MLSVGLSLWYFQLDTIFDTGLPKNFSVVDQNFVEFNFLNKLKKDQELWDDCEIILILKLNELYRSVDHHSGRSFSAGFIDDKNRSELKHFRVDCNFLYFGEVD